jgi:hypothetical protein
MFSHPAHALSSEVIFLHERAIQAKDDTLPGTVAGNLINRPRCSFREHTSLLSVGIEAGEKINPRR